MAENIASETCYLVVRGRDDMPVLTRLKLVKSSPKGHVREYESLDLPRRSRWKFKRGETVPTSIEEAVAQFQDIQLGIAITFRDDWDSLEARKRRISRIVAAEKLKAGPFENSSTP